MDSNFFHPISVHVPLTLALIYPFLILYIGFIKFKKKPSSPWLELSVLAATILLGSGIFAYITGEHDAFYSAAQPGQIESHRRWAEIFGLQIVVIFLGNGIYWLVNSFRSWLLYFLLLAFALANFFTAVSLGALGGKLAGY